jgi:hypothetical protein
MFVACTRTRAASTPEVVDLCDTSTEPKNNGLQAKSESDMNRTGTSSVAEGDVIVLDSSEFAKSAPTGGFSLPTGGDGIEVVGTTGTLRLPHAREHCTEKPFNKGFPSNFRKATNKEHCDLCYCFVCDCPVKGSSDWDQHCMATDKDQKWISLRLRLRSLKKQKETHPSSSSSLPSGPPLLLHQERMSSIQSTDSLRQVQNCQHCGEGSSGADWPEGRRDWYHACGRVTQDSSLGKSQSVPFSNCQMSTKKLIVRFFIWAPKQLSLGFMPMILAKCRLTNIIGLRTKAQKVGFSMKRNKKLNSLLIGLDRDLNCTRLFTVFLCSNKKRSLKISAQTFVLQKRRPSFFRIQNNLGF